MNVWYLSDLHLDTLSGSESTSRVGELLVGSRCNDWLIIAGDVGRVSDIVDLLSKVSPCYSKVFFVFGNHDYYDIQPSTKTYKKIIKEVKKKTSALGNVFILDNKVVTVDGITIAGSTNWYSLEENYSKAWWSSMSNDYTYVHPEGYLGSNLHSIEDTTFLESIKEDVDILITHIPPIHFKNNYFEPNEAFIRPLSLMFKPKYWVCGHQHFLEDSEYNGSRLLSNPMGYVGEVEDFTLRSFKV